MCVWFSSPLREVAQGCGSKEMSQGQKSFGITGRPRIRPFHDGLASSAQSWVRSASQHGVCCVVVRSWGSPGGSGGGGEILFSEGKIHTTA